jgi:hemerythrin-like metal-binding protein
VPALAHWLNGTGCGDVVPLSGRNSSLAVQRHVRQGRTLRRSFACPWGLYFGSAIQLFFMHMTIAWQASYQTGNGEIDAQHQELFDLANQFLQAADRAEKLLFAKKLFRHTSAHFVHEEHLMQRIDYPDIAAHFQEHTALLDRFNDFSDQIAADTLNNEDLEATVRTWLVNHIVGADAELVAYANAADS